MSSSKLAGSLGTPLCKLMLGGDCQLGRIPSATVPCVVQAGVQVMVNRPCSSGFCLTFFFPRWSLKEKQYSDKITALKDNKSDQTHPK